MRVLQILLLVPVTLMLVGVANSQVVFSIFPEKFELELLPGETYHDKIRISNLTQKPLLIDIQLKRFSAGGEKGEIKSADQDDNFLSSFSWIKFKEKYFILKANESKDLDFTIKVPNNAQPGGYYFVSFFKANVLSKEEAPFKILPTIGALFFIKIKGNDKQQPLERQIELIDFHYPNFVEKGPISISFRVKNNDFFHVGVGGKLVILDFFGKIKEEIKIKDQTILPQKIRIFEIETKNKFFIGPYQMNLILSTQNWREKFGHEKQIVKKFNFFAFPLKLFLIILSLIFILILFLKKLRKKI